MLRFTNIKPSPAFADEEDFPGGVSRPGYRGFGGRDPRTLTDVRDRLFGVGKRDFPIQFSER
jgi:hypothetical protein